MNIWKDIYKYLDNYINTDDNKKQKGEVFTPTYHIEKQLNEVPIYRITDKVLDSGSGIGSYSLVLFFKLFNYFKNDIPDDEERKKHIIENMLYLCELDDTNIKVTLNLFKKIGDYKVNIYKGDYLKLDIENEWGISKFNIIMGNPPYQKSNNVNNKARGGTNNNLYLEFISKSLNILSEDGYLTYIHPLNWRKIGSVYLKEFLERNLIFLALNTNEKLFKNTSVKTDYYVLQNNKEYNYTKILYKYKNNIFNSYVKLDKRLEFIPNVYNSIIQDILLKINSGVHYKCNISSYCHKVRDHVKDYSSNIYKYPLYNTSGNPFKYFSSKQHIDQLKKKVIMSNSGKLGVFYDDGKLGTTQDSMYILVENEIEGNNIVNILSSNVFKFLLDICQWGNFRNESKLIEYIGFPLNNEFNLTGKELDIVNMYENEEYMKIILKDQYINEVVEIIIN
jgi:tRNA1(Val) A37 N6-methylase TrmN6